jgi:beta-catenin-like protein 1
VLAKFVEGEYAKVERLLEIREGAVGRLSGVEGEIRQEREVSTPCS